MGKLKLELAFLLWCSVFDGKVAFKLDQTIKHLASNGLFSPKNLVLTNGEPITLPWENSLEFKPTITHLEIHSCKGTIDNTTFSRLPDLRNLQINDCHINHLYSDSFSNLSKLEVLGFSRSHINFNKLKEDDRTSRAPLEHFKELHFQTTVISGLSGNALRDLSRLNKLCIENSGIFNIKSDLFDGFSHLTHLMIKTTEIPDFDVTFIMKLKSLKYLAMHDLETNSKLDYNVFRSLPNLETILFDSVVYKDMDIEGFAQFHNC